MPAFGGILPPEAIWRLVTYLQSLAPAQDMSTTSWVPR
jgi:mono/diheme cytochrome c family protein